MKPVQPKDIRTWLESQGQKVILDMLMAQVASDGRLRPRAAAPQYRFQDTVRVKYGSTK